MAPENDFSEDLSDFIIPERSYSDDEFEVLPDTGRGPSAPIILHVKAEIEQERKALQREYGNIEQQSQENPELSEIRKTEKEIKKHLQTYENELSYKGSIRSQKNDDADDEMLINKKNLPIFLGPKYFKAYPASDSGVSTASNTSSSTTISDDTAKSTAEKNNELYLSFSTDKFNYSFPYANKPAPTGKRRL